MGKAIEKRAVVRPMGSLRNERRQQGAFRGQCVCVTSSAPARIQTDLSFRSTPLAFLRFLCDHVAPDGYAITLSVALHRFTFRGR